MASAPTIGAIETEYAGVRFRSRTEARWAVFFDALGLKWEHEPEAYTDGRTWYTPDFWLPELDCFWEVKGTPDYDLAKVSMLCRVTGKELVVSYQSPADAALDSYSPEEPWLSVDWWHHVDLSPERRRALVEHGELVDGITVVGRFASVVTDDEVIFRDGSLPTEFLQASSDCVVRAAALATRFRFWEPDSTRPARVSPVCVIERSVTDTAPVSTALEDAIARYRIEWADYEAKRDAFVGEWDDPRQPVKPVMPVYPPDDRVVSGDYNDRHDNLARKWFYEIPERRKKQVKKVYARKGSISVEFHRWVKFDSSDPWTARPEWLDLYWETGDGDQFNVEPEIPWWV